MDADDPEAGSASAPTRSRPWRAKPRKTSRVFEETIELDPAFEEAKQLAEERQRKYGKRGLGSNAARYEETMPALDGDGLFVYEVLSMIAITKELKAK